MLSICILKISVTSGGAGVDGRRGVHFPPWHPWHQGCQPGWHQGCYSSWHQGWLEQTPSWGKPGYHQKLMTQVTDLEYSLQINYLGPIHTLQQGQICCLHSFWLSVICESGLCCRNSWVGEAKSWWQRKDKCSAGQTCNIHSHQRRRILISGGGVEWPSAPAAAFHIGIALSSHCCNVFKHLLLYLSAI